MNEEQSHRAVDRRGVVRVAKWMLRLAIAALVVVGISRTVERAGKDLERQEHRRQARLTEIDALLRQPASQPRDAQATADLQAERRMLLVQRVGWRHVSAGWLLTSAGIYVLACIPCWIFWHQTLRALGQRPTPGESLRAYFVGHLGKYVPGKALVVILRAGMVRSTRVDTTVAVASVFIETLTMMAVGAALSALLLIVQEGEGRRWLPWAVVLMLGASLPTIPAIFRRVVRRLQPRQLAVSWDESLAGLDLRLMARGWLWMTLSWIGMALSLWAAVHTFPGDQRSWLASLADLPVLIACVALAVVLGFVSLIPGGFGVRELVVTTLLAPLAHVGVARALGAAVVLRLAWLLAEVVVSIILYAVIRGPEAAVRISAPASPVAPQQTKSLA